MGWSHDSNERSAIPRALPDIGWASARSEKPSWSQNNTQHFKPYCGSGSLTSKVQAGSLPEGALLARYSRAGAFTDCYTLDVPGQVSQAKYVEAFYTGRVFKLERLILRLLVGKASTDAEARELAAGRREAFAAWTVEARAADQLLMCDYLGRTRSWLMTAPRGSNDLPTTRLYFGSAIVPVIDKSTGQPTLGSPFKLLLGFHKRYSRVLLSSARTRLAQMPRGA